MPDWMSTQTKTLMVAALFLALVAGGVMGSADGSEWFYTENETGQGLAFNVATLASPKRGPSSVLRFSFQTQTQCEPTVGLAHFRVGNDYGKRLSVGRTPEEWAVQVDDHSPEQGRAAMLVNSNSIEIVLPVTRALVSDAKSGRLVRSWQTAAGAVRWPPGTAKQYPPGPPESRAHVEFSLSGAARPLERAESSCVEALRR